MYDYEITFRTRDGATMKDCGYGDHAQDAMKNWELDYPTTKALAARKVRS